MYYIKEINNKCKAYQNCKGLKHPIGHFLITRTYKPLEPRNYKIYRDWETIENCSLDNECKERQLFAENV